MPARSTSRSWVTIAAVVVANGSLPVDTKPCASFWLSPQRSTPAARKRPSETTAIAPATTTAATLAAGRRGGDLNWTGTVAVDTMAPSERGTVRACQRAAASAHEPACVRRCGCPPPAVWTPQPGAGNPGPWSRSARSPCRPWRRSACCRRSGRGVARGRVLLSSAGVLAAADPVTGRVAWRRRSATGRAPSRATPGCSGSTRGAARSRRPPDRARAGQRARRDDRRRARLRHDGGRGAGRPAVDVDRGGRGRAPALIAAAPAGGAGHPPAAGRDAARRRPQLRPRERRPR